MTIIRVKGFQIFKDRTTKTAMPIIGKTKDSDRSVKTPGF